MSQRKPPQRPPSFVPGTYLHTSSGDTYTAVGLIPDSTNSRPGNWMVHYLSHAYGTWHVRDINEFLGPNEGDGRPRFVLVEVQE